jgi:hypothetical protein
MSKRMKSLPLLIFGQSMFPPSLPPGTERPEPYGFALKEPNFFRADEDLSVWERYIGWHDWAVLLNCEMGRLYDTARACLDGRHPINQAADGEGDLTYAEQMVAGLPQFCLCVWELALNGWSQLIPQDPVSRVLLEVREARPVCGRRSAVDATFTEAVALATVLEQCPELRDGLAGLRQRHARQHAAHPWCWLRFFGERHDAFDILCMLQYELQRWQGNKIVTPDQVRCERWHKAAQQWLLDLMGCDPDRAFPNENAVLAGCNPGFDWFVDFSAVDVTALAERIFCDPFLDSTTI